MAFHEDNVREALAGFPDPETGRDIVTLEQVGEIQVNGNTVRVELRLTSHSAPIWEETKHAVVSRLRDRLEGIESVDVQLVTHQRAPEPLGEIGLPAKSVIAVGSGKGGVGKSTIAAGIACSLTLSGCEVGLLDADVYGPSVPHLLGLSGRPEIIEGKIQPATVDQLRVMSMGFMVPADEPVVWRGPMLHGAITQMLRDTAWRDLDYLIIDMPPGTGDIAISLSQVLPLTGAIVVCTPQDVALLDAVKAIAMFQKVNIPLLGMVENMSGFRCDCGKQHDIFGKGGAKKRAATLDTPFLGEVPINVSIREQGDSGTIMDLVRSDQGVVFNQLCKTLVSRQAKANADRPTMPSLPVL